MAELHFLHWAKWQSRAQCSAGDSETYGQESRANGNDEARVCERRAGGAGFGEGHEDNDGITLVDVPVQDLPKGKKLTVAVRPVSSLGTKGKTIGTTFNLYSSVESA